MKILMTYHGRFDANSGASGSMIRIGEELRKEKLDVDYFTYDNLPSFQNKRYYHFLFPYFLNQYIRQKDFDIIDACTGDTWLFGTLNRKRNQKIVIRSSGLEHMDYESRIAAGYKASLKSRIIWGYLNLKLVQQSLMSADHIFALTTQEKEYIEKRFKVPGHRISIAYHALPKYFLNLKSRSACDNFRVLYVGLWNERKGVQYLTEALEMLVKTNLDFSVTLAGVKVEESLIRATLSDSLNAKTSIITSILHTDLPDLYLTHSVFVFPSRYEGFGKVIMEAMASGIPIITSSTGIAHELIHHHINGLKIPSCDSKSIYNSLIWVSQNPEKAVIYGKRAREAVEAINFDSIYKQRINIYKALIAK